MLMNVFNLTNVAAEVLVKIQSARSSAIALQVSAKSAPCTNEKYLIFNITFQDSLDHFAVKISMNV